MQSWRTGLNVHRAWEGPADGAARATVTRIPTSTDKASSAHEGVALADLSLRLIAVDHGAAAILNGRPGPMAIPREIQESIRRRRPTDQSPVKVRFRLGDHEYLCRSYLVDSPDPVFVLHVERTVSASDAVTDVAAAYHLTNREREALEGIALGLSSKELADRMQISPNTVKAFLRLIMIKMGVTTRAAIIAKLLGRSTGR